MTPKDRENKENRMNGEKKPIKYLENIQVSKKIGKGRSEIL